MARIARLTIPGMLHHIISRFVDREWFLTSDEQRTRYLSLLGRALSQSDWRCVAYCVMSNHLHLGLIAGRDDLESWTKKVNSPFANWLNDQQGRLGPVYADRPAAFVVPKHREAEVIAYIHNNPVRANLVTRARDSSWSSHQAYVGLTRAPSWLHVGEGLRRAGCENSRERFESFVDGRAGATLELPELEQLRADARLLGQYELGTPTLSEPAEVPIVSRASVGPRPAVTELVAAVMAIARVSGDALTRRWARGSVGMSKRVVIHSAVRLGISISDASAAVSVSRQRGSRVAREALSAEERAVVEEVLARLGRSEPKS